jgi:hypothetical protein
VSKSPEKINRHIMFDETVEFHESGKLVYGSREEELYVKNEFSKRCIQISFCVGVVIGMALGGIFL